MKTSHFFDRNGIAVRVKDRRAAYIIALFAGWLGIHKFYLGRVFWGIVYLLFSWTVVPLILSIIETFLYFFMTEEEFDYKYNR